MTGLDLATLIAFRLGGRTDLADAVLAEMRAAQLRLERMPSLPWFLLTSDLQVLGPTVTGQSYIALPVDFLMEEEDEDIYIYDSTADTGEQYISLQKATSDIAQDQFQGSDQPKYYSLIGEKLIFQPTPNAAYALRWRYYAADDTLTLETENLWTKYAPLLIGAHAGVALATAMGNSNALTLFNADLTIETSRIVKETVARQEANRSRTMGERP